MRNFILNESRNAFERLKRTLIFIAKALCIGFVNCLFWFLPLILVGYLAVRPILAVFRGEDSRINSFMPEPRAELKKQNPINIQDAVRSARSVLNDIRSMKR